MYDDFKMTNNLDCYYVKLPKLLETTPFDLSGF